MKKLIVAAAILAAAGLLGTAGAQQKLKVGFIYVGPVGDMGYSYQHDVGRKEVEAKFKDGVLELTLPKKAAPARKAITIQ